MVLSLYIIHWWMGSQCKSSCFIVVATTALLSANLMVLIHSAPTYDCYTLLLDLWDSVASLETTSIFVQFSVSIVLNVHAVTCVLVWLEDLEWHQVAMSVKLEPYLSRWVECLCFYDSLLALWLFHMCLLLHLNFVTWCCNLNVSMQGTITVSECIYWQCSRHTSDLCCSLLKH